MNGNQITISVTSDDLNELRKIARTRGQTVADYISSLVSSNLLKSNSPMLSDTVAAVTPAIPSAADMQSSVTPVPAVLKTTRVRMR
jgi:hypothetical protein